MKLVKLPLAGMMAVPAALMIGYGIRLPAEDWSTIKPMLLGMSLIGMMVMIAGMYLFAEAARSKV